VEKPGRYCGGEHGRLADKDASLQTLIAFPDLYEIGMSNQALRIIYNGLNRIPGVSCDRAFAPAPDFEKLLREKGLPLYGLDTGVSLKSLDLLLFTLGYELGFSGILAMLDVSGIPLRREKRGESDPLIIAGGPAVSNPLPYSDYIDAFWIGEAEAGFFDLARELYEIKESGGNRAALLEYIQKNIHIWVKGKKAVRAVDVSFGDDITHNEPAVYPIPSMKIIQHHGILEIMRGCPNGCRFCHAGCWYRPMRQKNRAALVREAETFITLGGYREVSLSSLSSGDYAGIGELVDDLNNRFSARHVSFQLPSLRVSTFALSLLEKISTTRKSGLTFAVETPRDFWQMAINKQVTADSVVEILKEAKRNGWRGAKFYFMIGLPLLSDTQSEEEEIVNFVNNIAHRTSMHFNVNVGIFVPKPHTPYQWARQIDSQTAAIKLDFIRSRLKSRGHKVSVSDTMVSMLEGILSRGDERAGALFEQAFQSGNRLDPWKEFIARDVWRDIIARNEELAGQFLAASDPDAPLPWQDIVSGVAPGYLRAEFAKSARGELTPPCAEDCSARCGVCSDTVRIKTPLTEARRTFGSRNGGHGGNTEISQTTTPCAPCPLSCPQDSSLREMPSERSPDPTIWRLIFSFTKEGSAVFHGHLSIIEIFSMAMVRAGLDVLYTRGFNPLAKLEIVSPLSIGINAGAEIAAADFSRETPPGEFTAKMNAALPEGIRINRAEIFRIPAGAKKHSLSSLLWGFGYAGLAGETMYIPAADEKAWRKERFAAGETAFSLRRACVLAKNTPPDGGGQPWTSYFDAYGHLYSCKKIPYML